MAWLRATHPGVLSLYFHSDSFYFLVVRLMVKDRAQEALAFLVLMDLGYDLHVSNNLLEIILTQMESHFWKALYVQSSMVVQEAFSCIKRWMKCQMQIDPRCFSGSVIPNNLCKRELTCLTSLLLFY